MRARFTAWLALLLLLAGCAGTGSAPVIERGLADPPASGYHRVREGDTLYSIAWRYGVDWRTLARRNRIDAPYTIFPDQRLWILRDAPAGSRPASSERDSGRVAASAPAARPKPSAGGSGSRSEVPSPASDPPRWQWPLEGEVIQGFSTAGSRLSKGIDIRGAPGDRVRAVSDGEVVYAGTGLRGHRQLVIVKHDDTWLSAYAHNSLPLVTEGERVGRGDAVARLEGDGDRDRLLHFEIRREGKPVDPADLLPAR
ncbi:MAG: peptidoglycan DD-metalloendopeptidase family protein [Gammaproteobacteria bacterium]|nr:peptidoglycan DD-metalloendopeptidase family protein [Gammaproteobacteria bacterium]